MVRELDVLVAEPTDRPCSFLVGRACALVFLGGQLPDALARDFTLAERVELDQFTVERYRSSEPVEVTRRTSSAATAGSSWSSTLADGAPVARAAPPAPGGHGPQCGRPWA